MGIAYQLPLIGPFFASFSHKLPFYSRRASRLSIDLNSRSKLWSHVQNYLMPHYLLYQVKMIRLISLVLCCTVLCTHQNGVEKIVVSLILITIKFVLMWLDQDQNDTSETLVVISGASTSSSTNSTDLSPVSASHTSHNFCIAGFYRLSIPFVLDSSLPSSWFWALRHSTKPFFSPWFSQCVILGNNYGFQLRMPLDIGQSIHEKLSS